MYRVIQAGKTVDVFPTFNQAWIHICVELNFWAQIRGPDNSIWIVNPGQHHIN